MKKIEDEFSHIKSREMRLQLRRMRDGLCRACGMPRAPGSKVYCKRHLRKDRERARAKMGSKPWEPGRPGRKPTELR